MKSLLNGIADICNSEISEKSIGIKSQLLSMSDTVVKLQALTLQICHFVNFSGPKPTDTIKSQNGTASQSTVKPVAETPVTHRDVPATREHHTPPSVNPVIHVATLSHARKSQPETVENHSANNETQVGQPDCKNVPEAAKGDVRLK
jgi:hypothetical protein